jgi:uncharacterized protein YgiM (DUF1202 family)
VTDDIEVLHARYGPGLDYARSGYIKRGECARFLFRSTDNLWVKWEKGWSSTYYLVFEADISTLPVADR